MKDTTPKLDSLEALIRGSMEEIAHLRKAKEILLDMYFEADNNATGQVSHETLRKVHCFFGFDKGEDE